MNMIKVFSFQFRINFLYPTGILLSLFFLLPSTTHAALTSGLIGHWTFDGRNLTTATATDSSGNGNNGTLINSPKPTTGKLGQGIKFNGSNNYINVPYTSAFDFDSLTVSFWINPASDSGVDPGIPIVDNLANFGGGIDDTWGIYYKNGAVRFRAIAVGSYTAGFIDTSSAPVPLNKWSHVVVIWNKDTNTRSIYVNNIGVSGSPNDGSGWSINDVGNPIWIGRSNYLNRYSDSKLDEIRIYNRALSATEVAQLYKLGQTTQAPTTKVSTSTATTGLGGGLVGHWTFDGRNLTTATATDSSGLGNNGALVNTPKPTLGRLGQGLTFDGTSAYIDVGGGHLSFLKTSPFSGSSWIKTTKVTQMIFTDWANLVSPGWEFQISNGKLQFLMTNSGGTNYFQRASVASVNDGRWHHVAFSYSGSGTVSGITLYIDGVAQSSVSDVVFGTGDPGTLVDTKFLVGSRDGATPYRFMGQLDDVRVYNRALSATEVAQLYKLGQTTQPPTTKLSTSTATTGLGGGLVGHWTFDGRNLTTATATDSSGLGNNGTLVGGPKPKMGKLGQGINFSGVSTSVSVGAPNALNDLSQFTLSTWINPTAMGTNNSGRILDKTDNTTPSTGWSLQLNDNTNFRFQMILACSSGSIRRTSAPNSFKIGKWSHVAAIWDGTTSGTSIRIYINGVESSSYQLSQGCAGSKLSDAAQSLNIGNTSGLVRGLPGSLDDVRIYNRVLTATEIAQLYKSGTITVR